MDGLTTKIRFLLCVVQQESVNYLVRAMRRTAPRSSISIGTICVVLLAAAIDNRPHDGCMLMMQRSETLDDVLVRHIIIVVASTKFVPSPLPTGYPQTTPQMYFYPHNSFRTLGHTQSSTTTTVKYLSLCWHLST